MSILKNLIDFTAGLMGILFDKYEDSIGAGRTAAETDDLTAINGIGPTYARRLSEAGINTFDRLAALSPEQLREITRASGQGDPAGWIVEAESLAGREATDLERARPGRC
jgi:predicted flap endonuclease-1-like 5' DNA nuclease